MKYERATIYQWIDGEEMETEIFLLPEEDVPIGRWGHQRLQYIRDCKKEFYNDLVLSGTLKQHLAEVDQQAERIIEFTVTGMAQREGTDEALKAKDPMHWVGLMNNYRSCAEEIVCSELIYV